MTANNEVLTFISGISWPAVALIALIILGPGGILKSIVSEFSKNVIQLANAVSEFKETANKVADAQKNLTASAAWVGDFEVQISKISAHVEKIKATTDDLAITEGNRSLALSPAELNAVDTENAPEMTPAEMLQDIRERWDQICRKIKGRIGAANYDARSIGQIAWRLADGRRAKPITRQGAELIANLHTQIKRFNRLQSTSADWLTYEVYTTFITRADSALKVL